MAHTGLEEEPCPFVLTGLEAGRVLSALVAIWFAAAMRQA